MKFKPAILAAAVASFVAFSASANAADFPEMELSLAHSAAASHAHNAAALLFKKEVEEEKK